ncbi:hypothetical protein K3Z80_03975 [Pseudomonas aeruginosa]|nr:hypothetical protein [Pseudomonas aeruginosa]
MRQKGPRQIVAFDALPQMTAHESVQTGHQEALFQFGYLSVNLLMLATAIGRSGAGIPGHRESYCYVSNNLCQKWGEFNC